MANNLAFAGELAELQTSIQVKPQELYPPATVTTSKGITPEERLQIRFLKEVRYSIMHETPFYIQPREKIVGTCGDGIERYSDRWKPRRKAALSLMDLRTDERYFPEELLPVLNGELTGRKKRKLQTFDLNKFLEINVEDTLDVVDEGAIGEGDTAAEKDSDVEGEEGEPEDDEYSDDGNDYEDNYFDGGDDYGDDDGGNDEEAY